MGSRTIPLRRALAPDDLRLLEDFQRDFPLVPRPFAEIAAQLGRSEDEVLRRLSQLRADGKIARVGATVRPNTAGVSTLAALSVEDWRIEDIAALVGEEPGVNHSYQREHAWNLWFVATAASAPELRALLARIAARTGLDVLDLPLLRAFNIDLGFALRGPRRAMEPRAGADISVLSESDRPLLELLSQGLTLEPRPYRAAATRLGWTEAQVVGRIAALAAAGILTRVGVIVRHRPLGWSSNAMVAFDLPEDEIAAAGPRLAALPGITLCYQRRTLPDVWRWGLFCMIHARSRPEALQILARARALPELAGADHQILFSQRCFKQTGATLSRQETP